MRAHLERREGAGERASAPGGNTCTRGGGEHAGTGLAGGARRAEHAARDGAEWQALGIRYCRMAEGAAVHGRRKAQFRDQMPCAGEPCLVGALRRRCGDAIQRGGQGIEQRVG